MGEIYTVGELKKELEDYDDDTPVWLGATAVQGGLTYPNGVEKYYVEIGEETAFFGLALPKKRQRTERGLVIY